MVGRVVVETQLGHDGVQLGQQRLATCGIAEQTQRRDGCAGQLQRDEDGRDSIGGDQHAVLSDLSVGHAFHPTKHRIGKHNARADQQTGGVRHLEEAAKGHADAGHLTDHVGHGCYDQTDHRNDTCGLAVETVADEFRHGELAELAQVRCKQQRQQHIATGPTHQEGRVVIAGKGNQARHRDERGRRHPVRRCCHTVGDRVNAATGGVEFRCRPRAGPDRDADVQRKGRAHKQQVDGKLVHGVYSSSTPCSASSLFMRQA